VATLTQQLPDGDTASPVVRARPCPLCDTPAGQPCQDKPPADHLARFLESYIAGQLTKAYLAMVLGELVVIEACVVIGTAVTEPEPLGQLLAAGYTVSYEPDPVWVGSWFADLRDPSGRLTECGNGATQAEALADLARRVDGAR
jgi:hypothetical protein